MGALFQEMVLKSNIHNRTCMAEIVKEVLRMIKNEG